MREVALRVYYDGSCNMCSAEIDAIRAVAPQGAVGFIDCSPAGFSDDVIRRDGISRADMMQSMHVRDAAGRWYKGVDAFVQLYRHGGLPEIARLWANPLVAAVMRRVYPWIVRHRYVLSAMGLPRLTEKLIHFHAKRASRRSRSCSTGQCPLQ